ncbi:4'-phosphopantetheinyl transferase family protein [Paucibacter sp. Y2R2-4]|uniref:4'-phosphopantetheinyl transferase family protein n=1 Tax=Paucibacter sp. Y2R2-4 TaxID=2893553 RepID=UPI0021E3DEE7|nr:4'-phosphopantetheinyl transferase superfamily protein [Paucibacter sp. Y2R2-4]MCV2350892.1 4'-phosphopantetheinyl transferase superfamily protein [Paucibacter sp. Y2R2-4]
MSLAIELRCLDEAACLAHLPDTQAQLSPSELRRLQQFSHPHRRLLFLAGRDLARQVLLRRLGLSQPTLAIDAQGRSAIEGRRDLYLSIAHSGSWVACVVGHAPIGLDIENTGRQRDFLALARSVHSPTQCRAIEGASSVPEQAELFYRYWTLKEAHFKRQGLGLDLALMPQLEYLPSPNPSPSNTATATAASCFLPQLELMLALDGSACAGAALAAALVLPEGDRPVWQTYEASVAKGRR